MPTVIQFGDHVFYFTFSVLRAEAREYGLLTDRKEGEFGSFG
jgi:hypothetical protein